MPEPTGEEFFYGSVDRMMDGYRRTLVFLESVRLRLFDHTGTPTDAGHLAEALGLDAVMTGLLCDCLVTMGLLENDGGRFSNTPMSANYLTAASPISQFNNVAMAAERIGRWSSLEDALRNGPAVLDRKDVFNRRWITAIGEGAVGGGIGGIIDYMEARIPLNGLSTFIDVGGGHGLYSIGLSYRHPNLRGTVFDRPEIIDVAEENIRDYGIPVTTVRGDYFEDAIPGTYDLVFASFNQACSDPGLSDRMASLMADGGYMFLRRHRKEASDNAMRNLEWNLAIWDGMVKGQKKHGGTSAEDAESYLGRLREKGVLLISREIFDETSEVLVLRKEGA